MAYQGKSGKIKMLRVNDLGHVWGPPSEALHTQVTVMLDCDSERFFRFEIKAEDESLATQMEMLTTLRFAFNHKLDVNLSYEFVKGEHSGQLTNVQLC